MFPKNVCSCGSGPRKQAIACCRVLVLQVLGACVPDSPGPVAVVTELGDPLDTVRLLQLSWEDRLRVSSTRRPRIKEAELFRRSVTAL